MVLIKAFYDRINLILFDESVDDSSPSQVYGGFTRSDWGKVGNDLRKGIVQYGKGKSSFNR